jgi:hypothetical protein
MNATVANLGNKIEGFNLTAYANGTALHSAYTTVLGDNATVIAFTWNTSGFAKGNYTISAYAEPLPSEADTSDNNFTDGLVIVAMIGDIAGPSGYPDGKIDVRDVALICSLYGVKYPDPRYSVNWDITGRTYGLADGKIDVCDVALISSRYGQKDP